MKRPTQPQFDFLPPDSRLPAFAEDEYEVLASFDGAFEPRGTSRAVGSLGVVITDPKGSELHRASMLLPPAQCQSNNAAEYLALLAAIDWICANAADRAVLFQGDSQVVVHHCRGVWGWNARKTNWRPHHSAPSLLPLLSSALEGLRRLHPLGTSSRLPGMLPNANSLPIVWVPGSENPADGESREPLRLAGLWPLQNKDWPLQTAKSPRSKSALVTGVTPQFLEA